jgi:hypothetical protein
MIELRETEDPMTRDEWIAEGARRFGPDPMNWRFVCPACGHVATPVDWEAAGAPKGAFAFSCVGRWLPDAREAFANGPGPCNYAGGGLIGLNPTQVDDERIFAFAPEEMREAA